jgi:hypothetical protein
MRAIKTFGAGLVAAGLMLSVAGGALAAGATSHEGHAGAAVELSLNHGQKWPTDEVLRSGMGEMRNAMTAALGSVHGGTFTSADYAALADRLQGQIDEIVAKCKLPEEADAQLHIVLGEIIDGVEGMRAGDDRLAGALKVAAALEAYGKHFDHPGFALAAH